MTTTDPELVDLVAGLLSTIDFRPSEQHPETMRPWAEQVLALIAERRSDDH